MANNIIKDQTLNLFPDNVNGEITASDMRQFIDNIWWDKERKINKFKTLQDAFVYPDLYQLDLFLIVEEQNDSKNGVYVALVNQPVNEGEIFQVANNVKPDFNEVQTELELLQLNPVEGDICNVIDNKQTYIYDGSQWIELYSEINIQNAIQDSAVSTETLWSSDKINQMIATSSVQHTHEIKDIDGLENQLNILADGLNDKLENTNGKHYGILKLFSDSVNSTLEITNSQSAQALPTLISKIEPAKIYLKNETNIFEIEISPTEVDFDLINNGVSSTVLTLLPGSAPRSTYYPVNNKDLTNKEYVDLLFSQVPSPHDFATVQYVDSQDALRLSKYGDLVLGALNFQYSSSARAGTILNNIGALNPAYYWEIGQFTDASLQLKALNNGIEQDTGISIAYDAYLLEIDKNGLMYNSENIALESYVDQEIQNQRTLINSKVSKLGDTIYGDLYFRGDSSSIPKIVLQNSLNVIESELGFDLATDSFYINNLSAGGSVETLFEIRNNSNIYINDKMVWHQANQGTGSGLDADLLDGFQPNQLPISDDTQLALNEKLSLTGGTLTGDLNINGSLVANDIESSEISSTILTVSDRSNLNNTFFYDDVNIENGFNLNVSGETFSKNLRVQNIPDFNNSIQIGSQLSSDPFIIFTDNNSVNEPKISYDKLSKQFTITDDQNVNSKIWHENNLDIYFKTDFIDQSLGLIDAGKPVKLNSEGVIDASMLDISLFYFVGAHNPENCADPATGCEYPDTTGQVYGAMWVIEGTGTDGYTFQEGDLVGETVHDGDFMILSAKGWTLMAGTINPTLYYKLDGTNAITANFQAGGYKLVNLADGVDPQDAVTMNQVNSFSQEFYHRNGSNPLTNNFQAGGYQLKNIADGTDDTDAVSLLQMNTELALKADTTYVDSQDNLKVNKSGDTMTGSLSIQTGDFEIDNNQKINSYDSLGALKNILFIDDTDKINISENGMTTYIRGDDVYADTNFRTLETAPTQDDHLTRKDYVDGLINTKENSLGNPTEVEQYLTSDMSGNRSWVTPRKTFADLDDTPSDYTGHGGELVGVNQAEDALVFGSANPNINRHLFNGDGSETIFTIPGGYLPGNIDVYVDRVRQIVAPQGDGGDIDATDGARVVFYSPPSMGAIIEIAAYVKDSFLMLPNASESSVGGIRVRTDDTTGTIYITSDGTAP